MDRTDPVRLRFRRNAESRAAAHRSLHQQPNGRWSVRIGGPVRGCLRTFATRAAAERAVDDHYNELMLRFVRGGRP